MSLRPGSILGQYRIGRQLGSGGMGEVYLATHLILGRDVALKTLRPEAVGDDAQVSPLIREARAASALDHPNIVTVHDVANADGIVYIAMEYIEGQTLRQVLAQRIPSLKEALQYAIQIAGALAAAHDAGVLHLDVKPGNIMMARRNLVKVVDFGLARRFDPPGPSYKKEDAPTRSMESSPIWPGGGTVGYMSPEQIQFSGVDARSDIFSFGIVLYEMLTRVRPFAAPSDIAVNANILRAEPTPIHEIAPDVPVELANLVNFCLRKDPADRARSMHDVAHMLAAVREATERRTEAPATGSKRGRRWLVAAIAATLALIAGAAAGVAVLSRGSHARLRPSLRRITWDDGLAESPALSNDGSLVAFASDRAGGKNLDIYVRHMSGGEPIRLTSNPADETDPSFSPDGGMIAFRSERQGGGVYIMPSFGGQERLVAPRGNSPRFSPDGKWIAYWIGEWANTAPSARMYIVPATGGTPRQLQPSFADARFPIWAPDGAHILFQGVDVWKSDTDPNPDWWVTPVDESKPLGAAVKTGAWDSITRSGLPYIYAPGGWRRGRVVFPARDDSARFVLQIPVSTQTWRVQGPAEALTFGTGIEGDPYPSASGAVAFASSQYEINLWSRSLDESGRPMDKEAQKLTAGAAYHSSASMSANGTRMVFLLGRSPSRNVWIRDLATGQESAVTVDAADKCSAAISADGSRVAWSGCGPGPEPVYLAGINSDLSIAIPEKVCADCGRVVDWSRTGDSILFVDRSHPVRVGVLTLSSGLRTMISSSRYNLNRARYSPDGNWIALGAAQMRDDRAQLFAIPLRNGEPAPESAWVSITNADFWNDNPVWTERGDALLFYSRRDGFGCIWRQAVNRATKQPEGLPTEVVQFHGGRLSIAELTGLLPSLSLVHDRLVFNALEVTGSIWVLDDGPGTSAGH